MLGGPQFFLGAVVAALIAGLVAFLVLVISKEQKVAECRQAWIDSLRDDVASLITHSIALHGARAAKYPMGSIAWEATRVHLLAVNEASAKIRLRLNPEDGAAVAVLNYVSSISKVFSDAAVLDPREVDPLLDSLVVHCQILLRQEWLRVRAGERMYRIARNAALIVLGVALVVLLTSPLWPMVGGALHH